MKGNYRMASVQITNLMKKYDLPLPVRSAVREICSGLLLAVPFVSVTGGPLRPLNVIPLDDWVDGIEGVLLMFAGPNSWGRPQLEENSLVTG